MVCCHEFSAAKSKCQKNEEWTETEYNNICKTVLLSTEDVRIWIEHVGLTSERRKAGAKKAAETRARKRKDNEVVQVERPSDDDELWCCVEDQNMDS
ncbi:hypothetical protein OS493_023897 [Desmophyllum pertusum]|uniref:Uncharacterized protein n=1 Tax=Desmophyllum pertusum TaxID=174260 RepID=A0A9W9YAR0_9CNID|nr:hypothetical protein OS493_023897 [Desmophyllum pertusum]